MCWRYLGIFLELHEVSVVSHRVESGFPSVPGTPSGLLGHPTILICSLRTLFPTILICWCVSDTRRHSFIPFGLCRTSLYLPRGCCCSWEVSLLSFGQGNLWEQGLKACYSSFFFRHAIAKRKPMQKLITLPWEEPSAGVALCVHMWHFTCTQSCLS